METVKAGLMEAFQARFRFAGGRFIAAAPSGAPREAQPFGPTQWQAVGRDVRLLHEAYTSGKGSFRHESNPIHGAPAGYQFYFLPRNLFRVWEVLHALPWQEERGAALPELWRAPTGGEVPFSLLDLGCGSGAFSLAVLSWLAAWGRLPAAIHLELVDQGHGLIELAEANVRALCRRLLPQVRLEIRTHMDGVENFLSAPRGPGKFQVAGSAMMLNELGLLLRGRAATRAARIALPLKRLVRRGGLLLFVEPGTRKGYMNLMAIRGQAGAFPLLYPCPHGRPCPLWNARVSRWCHATRPLPHSFFFDESLRRGGRLEFSMREVNLFGLAFQANDTGRPSGPFRQRKGGRVVSGRLPAVRNVGPKKAGAKKAGAKRPARPTKKKGSPGRDAPPERVLLCTQIGKLEEVLPPAGERHPRGLWLDDLPEQTPPTGARAWEKAR